MASSGSFATNTYSSRGLAFYWSVASQSVSGNYSIINWTLQGTGGSTTNYFKSGNFYLSIDGVEVYSSATRINLFNGTVVASGSFTLYHDNAGNKTFSAYAQAGIYTVAVNVSGSGSWSLPQIPRYANITTFTVSKRDETSVTVNWNADSTCDSVAYAINNGGWIYTTGLNIVIGGLNPGTTYNIKIAVRRADSQLWSYSSEKSVTTYSYPYCNSAPSFIIGNILTLGIYNPLGRSVKVYFVTSTGTELGGDTITGTSISGYITSAFQKGMYQSLGATGTSAQYKVKVVYGSISTSVKNGGTYSSSPSYCKPVLINSVVEDVNPTTLALTNNSSQLIMNFSTARITPTYRTSSENDEVSTLSYKTLDGINFTESYTDVLNTTKNTFNLKATNSKNYTSDDSVITGTMHPYIPLLLTECLFERPHPTGSTMTVKFKGNYYDSYFDTENDENHNTLTIKWYVRKTESDSWTLGGTLIANTDYTITNNVFENTGASVLLDCPSTIDEGVWDYKSPYFFKFEVTDLLYTSSNPVVYYQSIKIGKPYFEWWRENKINHFNVNGRLHVEGNELNVYSTDEFWVGKWIDGRDLYGKVFPVELYKNHDNEITHNIQNFDTHIFAYGSIYVYGSGQTFTIPSGYDGYGVSVYTTSSKIYVKTENMIGGEGYLILMYLKSTD